MIFGWWRRDVWWKGELLWGEYEWMKKKTKYRWKWEMDMLLLSKYFVFGYFEIILTIRSISIHKQWRFKNWMAFISSCTIIINNARTNITIILNLYITTTNCTIIKRWTLINRTVNSIFACLSLHKSSWRNIMRILQSEDKRFIIIFAYPYWLSIYHIIIYTSTPWLSCITSKDPSSTTLYYH